MDGLTWLLLGLVLVLAAVYLHVHQAADWLTYTSGGVGGGIGLALAGSFIHDVFSTPHTRP